MNTTETTTTFKTDLLEKTALIIKEAGMKVFYTVWGHDTRKPTYFYFTDGDQIGYCQENLGGIDFSTVHKPCKECGTGFAEIGQGKTILGSAKRAFIIAPDWANSRDFSAVVKYKNWAEYTTKNNSCTYIEF